MKERMEESSYLLSPLVYIYIYKEREWQKTMGKNYGEKVFKKINKSQSVN